MPLENVLASVDLNSVSSWYREHQMMILGVSSVVSFGVFSSTLVTLLSAGRKSRKTANFFRNIIYNESRYRDSLNIGSLSTEDVQKAMAYAHFHHSYCLPGFNDGPLLGFRKTCSAELSDMPHYMDVDPELLLNTREWLLDNNLIVPVESSHERNAEEYNLTEKGAHLQSEMFDFMKKFPRVEGDLMRNILSGYYALEDESLKMLVEKRKQLYRELV